MNIVVIFEYTMQKVAALGLVVLVVVCFSLAGASLAMAQEEAAQNTCEQALQMIKSQKSEISRELRNLKREMALLKDSVGKPGVSEILGGIGYILGLLGVSYYWQARNLMKDKG